MVESIVIVGSGVCFAFLAPDAPRVADEYYFKNHMLTDGGGQYRVKEVDSLTHHGTVYPHIVVDRIGPIPLGTEGIKIEATQ